MVFRSLAIAALTAASLNAQAKTLGAFEQQLAEAKVALSNAASAREVGRLLLRYQLEATYECNVSFYASQGANAVIAPFKFVKDFGWAVIVGKEVLRETTGEQGPNIQPQLKVATKGVVAKFSETNETHIGEYGTCTLALEKIKLAQAEGTKRGQRIQTTIEVDGQNVPVIIVPDERAGNKK